jgi:hypothetical protein
LGRESRFDEQIVWQGEPQVVSPSGWMRALGAALFAIALVSTCFAFAISLVLARPPTATVLFAGWVATLGLACFQGPKLWLRRVRYVVTENHVIVERGPFRRRIERNAISFARIFWHPSLPGVGDIELVRAVPTGALRRRLMLRLHGLSAPDRVWAIIRGSEHATPAGREDRPLAQRLDRGERVVWSARPKATLRAYLPSGRREWMLLLLSAFLLMVVARMSTRAAPNLLRLDQAGLVAWSPGFIAVFSGVALTVLLVATLAGTLAYYAVLRPGQLAKQTRYLVTNKRVLIQRGREELHLGRDKIVDVIDAPAGEGLRHVFLVLDGPRARALAASGAFGEGDRGPELRPVLESLEDAEGVSRILRQPSEPELPRAA